MAKKANSDYTPMNANTELADALTLQQEYYKGNPDAGKAYTQEEKQELFGGITDPIWNTGVYTKDKEGAMAAGAQWGVNVEQTGYNGDPGYYYVPDVKDQREVQQGASGADEGLMTNQDYAIIQQQKAIWDEQNAIYQQLVAAGKGDSEEAKAAQAAMNQAHVNAERIRAGYGYSGGLDGSDYLTHGQLGLTEQKGTSAGSGSVSPGGGAPTGGSPSGGGSSGGGTSVPGAPDLTALLNQWKEAAAAQANGQIDYGVQKAIIELERALADAQPQFKEQQEAIYRDEMNSRDNSALYSEARGDKGGIGEEQYSSIMNTAAQNRLAVQQAQTKLSTDTQRQIADLRAQGEFEKADKMLEITQQYLSQLIGLEQWAAEYGLSVAQFQESIRQWQAEFQESIRQYDQGFAYQQYRDQVGDSQWQQQFDYTKLQNTNSQLASAGEAMLAAGIMPSASQLAAMGMDSQQAQSYVEAVKLAAQNEQNLAWYKATKGNSDSKVERPSTNDQVYKDAVAMLENGASDEAIYNYLKSVSPENADTYAGFLQIEIPEKPNSTGNIGLGYFMALPQAQMMKAQGKSAREILAYLDTFSEEELSNEGLDTILRILNLGNYNS